jgi:hypothetical protein
MEDFVPYKLAVKLKQKGFKQGYNIFGYRPIFSDETTFRFISYIGAYKNEYFGENISAPTISQVLDWLRDEKKIYVSVEVEREDWFEYKIVQTIKNTRRTGTKVYETYSKAILAGIEYVIDNNLI